MKKGFFFLQLVAAVCLTFCFTQCHKERRCGATITCLCKTDDVVFPAKGAIVYLDTLGKYNHEFMNITENANGGFDTTYFSRPISDTLHARFPYIMPEGIYHFELPHPALLALEVVYTDTTVTPNVNYIGHTQITLEEGELNKTDTVWLQVEN